jgi:PAS domain S-box-containing protein
MNLFVEFYLVISICSLAAGVAVYLNTFNKKLKTMFLFFALAVSYWAFTGYLLRTSTTIDEAVFYQKIGGFWPFAVAILLHFILYYTGYEEKIKNKIIFYSLVYTPAFLISIIELISPQINAVKISPLGFWESTSPQGSINHIFSNTWSAVIAFITLLMILNYYLKEKEKKKKNQAMFVFIGLFITIFLSILTEVILPLFSLPNLKMTVPGFGIGLFFISYSIWRYGLFEISQSAESEKIISTIPDILMIVDKNKTITMVNSEFERRLDYQKNGVVGKSADIVLDNNNNNNNIFDLKKSFDLETNLITSSGEKIPVQISTNVIDSKNKEPQELVILARDISESKKTNKELKEYVEKMKESELATISMLEDLKLSKEEIQKQNIELKNLDRLKNNFINVTSHELRTPMASIKGYVQMLLKQKLGNITDEEKNALEIVLRNTNRLDKLIQDILDLSRLESGNMKYIPEKTDIISLIEEVKETMSAKSDEKKIKIKTEVDKEIPLAVIDPEKIRQVIMNLVDNSIKFSDNGTVINLKAKKEKNDILIEIQDFGRGVPETQKDKVFETFYQVDSGEDRKYGGTGLGLAISKSIIQAHGGNIWVESKGVPHEGSIFKFTIPLDSEKAIRQAIRDQDMFKVEKNEK